MSATRHPRARGASLLGSLIILGILGILFYLAYGRRPPPDAAGSAAPVDPEAPARLAPRDARRHVEVQTCKAACARTRQLCRATAEGDVRACDAPHADCTDACEETAP